MLVKIYQGGYMKNFGLKSIGLAVLLSGNLMALNIADTPHGGIVGGSVNDNNQICVYCHTPHAGRNNLGPIPLWNKPATNLELTNGFTMYGASSTNTEGETIAGTKTAVQPQSQTLACLSCHDGVSAMNSVINAPGSGLVNPVDGTLIGTPNDGRTMYDFAFLAVGLGGDLTDDHPLSIEYIPGRASLKPLDTILTNSFGANKISDLLRNGKVECVSCHDPHGTGNPRYLRTNNTQSALCLNCHDK